MTLTAQLTFIGTMFVTLSLVTGWTLPLYLGLAFLTAVVIDAGMMVLANHNP